MKKTILSAALLLLSVGGANAWSEQNCMLKCKLTAARGQAEACYAKMPCSKYAGGNHESESVVRRGAADWNAKNRSGGKESFAQCLARVTKRGMDLPPATYANVPLSLVRSANNG